MNMVIETCGVTAVYVYYTVTYSQFVSHLRTSISSLLLLHVFHGTCQGIYMQTSTFGSLLVVFRFCEAYKTGMTGTKYVWIMVGWYDDGWWRTRDPAVTCTIEEMDRAAEGYVAAGDVFLNPSGLAGLAGITPTEFLDLYNNRTNYGQPHGSNLVAQMYDAVWAMALALNKTEAHLVAAGYAMFTFLCNTPTKASHKLLIMSYHQVFPVQVYAV